jgi:hypothetical protein
VNIFSTNLVDNAIAEFASGTQISKSEYIYHNELQSQGQSVNMEGICSNKKWIFHGQLYVALSRVKSKGDWAADRWQWMLKWRKHTQKHCLKDIF